MNLLKIWNSLGQNVRKVYLPQHLILLAGITSILFGYTSAWWLLLIYPSWFLFGHIGYHIFFHKYFCHKSFKTYPWIERLGAYLGMLVGTGTPVMLKVLHMGYHHPYSDTELDPHTPRRGFWWSYFLYQNHKWDFKKVGLVKEIMKDPWQRFYHKNYYKIYWSSWIILAMINLPLAIFSISAATVIEFHLSGFINVYGHTPHRWSYQNYTDIGESQNIPWLNWVTLGIGLHNNHHGKPGDYNFAHRPGEIDFAKWFVPLIERRQ